ncbi:MAG: hypothetical protein K0Q48_265 [Bacillota bacterium]|nr:hypothetical protein [Bacillota bacterium]
MELRFCIDRNSEKEDNNNQRSIFITEIQAYELIRWGRLTQQARVPSSQGGSRWFESNIAHQLQLIQLL